mgnify:CR=1 FL=1
MAKKITPQNQNKVERTGPNAPTQTPSETKITTTPASIQAGGEIE